MCKPAPTVITSNPFWEERVGRDLRTFLPTAAGPICGFPFQGAEPDPEQVASVGSSLPQQKASAGSGEMAGAA